IAEGAGEDPLLGSAMAAAYVRGFQSEPGFLACAKHYAAYGAAEAGRDYNAVEMSERTLREVYLPPFHAAVDAGVATLMSAFESLNGVPASANRFLLDDILRKEWKFKGFVVSDWDAVAELINHGVAANKREAAARALSAGVDVDMWDNSYAMLREGDVPMSVIDRAVRRVLRMKFRAGLFDDPYTSESAAPLILHRDAARRVAQKSIVLLKNENALLPLPKTGRAIAVVGPLADSKEDMLGPWSAQGKAEECVTPAEAIGATVPVEQADVIIAILGESRHMSGEAASRTSLDLPDDQQKLLESLVATGKPVILVVMSGRPLAISWAAEHVGAIVQAWFLGTESGHALADVLFGDVNPSGRLPVTVPRATGQAPIYYNHLPTGRPADPKDKYTSKYLDVPIGPLYPFGFGLSYTKFEYSDIRVDGLKVSATIRNSGDRPGEEIVQMYIRDPVASVSRPVKELKGFQRVALKPGESRRVEFNITRRDLQFWSNNGWIAEPGEFKVWIGPSSATGLEGTFALQQRARSAQ
ncbi:MAG TPA: glycoside hydrolase family 3 C-terminal domain-containing protein, partial [Thermoanaerobaculia bacterium]